MSTTLKTFRTIAYLEGASFLILLFIAMPLKYAMGLPLAVKYVGWLHGILFVAYVGILVAARDEQNWSVRKTFLGFLAGVLPFGTFVFERSLETAHVKN